MKLKPTPKETLLIQIIYEKLLLIPTPFIYLSYMYVETNQESIHVVYSI